ncbi:MAG TPA: FAD-dependent oxidoreductase [Moheibacter sp.]|nr:FAD-dependent oxidoreductase [Moheibacter sp.]
MLDYLIIGQGVAGSCFALKCLKEKKSFIVIDQNQNMASSVAVGIYNPVVLKRFSLIWNAVEQLKLMHKYFSEFEDLLGDQFIEEMPTYRILKNQDEINAWEKKSALPELVPFLSDEFRNSTNDHLQTPFGFAEVKQTGRIHLGKCISLFRNYLTERNLYRNESFDYSELKVGDGEIIYKETRAKNIIFCEGFHVLNNPYFNYLPVIGVKGEVLEIKTATQIPKAIWKAHNFLMPETGDICLTASTYDRDDLTYEPTQKGRQEMQLHLEEIYSGDYKIMNQKAGIRPTIVDRRPILGCHPEYSRLFILNGMGTRGTLLAPQMTELLFEHIEIGKTITKEADVRRFDKFWK